MEVTHAWDSASSIVALCDGSGSSIFLIKVLQARGDRLFMVGGHAEIAWDELEHADA